MSVSLRPLPSLRPAGPEPAGPRPSDPPPSGAPSPGSDRSGPERRRHLGIVPRPGVATEKFRAVFRNQAAGVAVITADDGHGPVGFTATSVISLSLEPPLVSFTISVTSSSFRTLQQAPAVVINFLDDRQADLATRFATSGVDRFAAPLAWSRHHDGSPVLDDAPSILHGPVERRIDIGDHQLVVLRSIHAEQRRTYAPLLHHAGAFGSVRSH